MFRREIVVAGPCLPELREVGAGSRSEVNAARVRETHASASRFAVGTSSETESRNIHWMVAENDATTGT